MMSVLLSGQYRNSKGAGCRMIHNLITPHAQRERGKVIGRGVHIYIYIYIYVCGRKKNLNRTLEIDSPFQTLTVGLLVEFID